VADYINIKFKCRFFSSLKACYPSNNGGIVTAINVNQGSNFEIF